jgi:hypothetical protein
VTLGIIVFVPVAVRDNVGVVVLVYVTVAVLEGV